MIELWNNEINEEEIECVGKAIRKRCISEGSIAKIFAQKLAEVLDVKYTLLTPNGTSALTLALMGAGIQPGDEVIVPDITFIATANAAKILGAKVIVCDTDVDKPLMNYENVIELITERTKAIIPVHLNGRRACTKELKEYVKGRGIFIIDDACQAFMSGESDNFMGKDADIACYSFGITKTVTTGQGGLVITDNADLYEKMQRIKLQGVDSIFECSNYIYNGFNFKMMDYVASIGIGQIGRIKEKKEQEWKIWNTYKEGLQNISGIRFISRTEEELPWMTEILCEDRDKIREILRQNNIDSRPIGHCLHEAGFLETKGSYLNASSLSKKILYLPSGPNQSIKNIETVIDVLKKNQSRLG